eukprot:15459086-Alexandrium_andersonii.AAC.1
MWFSCRMLRVALSLGLPSAIENPASSRIWHEPPLARLVADASAHAVTEFCQQGSPYRKRTKVVLWGGSRSASLACSVQWTEGLLRHQSASPHLGGGRPSQ